MHDEGPIGCLVGVIVGCILGIVIGTVLASRSWKYDVIKRGAGEYNSSTGEFQWVEDKESEGRDE